MPPAAIQLLHKFHYVLRPAGYLALGAADQSAGIADLFAEVEGTSSLLQPRNVPPGWADRSSAVATNTSFPDIHQRLFDQYEATLESQLIAHDQLARTRSAGECDLGAPQRASTPDSRRRRRWL